LPARFSIANGRMNTGRADLRVALVYVGAPEDAQYPVMSPPVGIQLLGAVLLRAGYHVELFDTRLQPSQELRELLGTYDPRVVGLSFLSPSSGQDPGDLADARQ
jgi:hypothetical protein